ncbi:bifunctional diguanylate cyclase/phosphodiesterase [Neptuniibacter halophilus]|uniref:bifunctional diguanylate cyclase/phosphodiesterase n=1 Tax=Neptuniibacter halophilus TaxID=651666 RepID=UPI00257420BE|nr:cache domain-containing protein [Neptuniibacter halophilus]
MTQIKATSLSRYLLFGTVAIAVLLLASVASHFLYKNLRDNEQRLAALEQEIMQKGRDQLLAEVNSAKDYISYTLARAEQVLQEQSKAEVLKAHSIAETIYQRERDRRPLVEIKELIRETLRDIRFFNGRGYIFIDDDQGNCVLLPTSPQVEGKSLYDNQDDTGHYIMRGLLEAVDNPQGEGFSRYRWYPPHDQKHMADKIAFVKAFEPFSWVIGAGDYLYRIEDDLKVEALKRLESIRFGEHGYFAVFSPDGAMLTSPGISSLQGKHQLTAEQKAQEEQVLATIMTAAQNGGGFVEYDWYFPNGRDLASKVSLVDTVPGLGWILVAGFYPEDIRQLLDSQQRLLEETMREDRVQIYLFLILATLVTLALSLLFSGWLNRRFTDYHNEIENKQQALELASKVFDSASEGIMVSGSDNRLLAVNDAFVEITGYPAEEAIGRNPRFLQSGRHDAAFYTQMWQNLNAHGQWSGEIWNRRKNGELFPQWISIIASTDNHGMVQHYIASIADLTERKQVEEKLRYLSDYDPLTNLPNRRLLGYRVEQTISLSKRKQSQQFALLLIDLDHFKNINDSLGHRFGDEILQKVAERIQKQVRDGDTVSRLGGDEFMILMPALEKPEQAANLADRILQQVAQPLEAEGHMTITPSVGIAVYPDDGDSFDELMRNADAAMHFAKKQGRNNYQFYTAEMNQHASNRLKVEIALRKAIENQEFELFYQPQLQLENGRLAGFEALIRWRNPETGLVPPNDFIPLAEETGLILQIGNWVLQEACRQGARWLAQSEHPFTMSVNVSVRQFRPDLVQEVRSALVMAGLPPEALVIEITESSLMQNQETTLHLLQELKKLGVQLSLDDFGTGYSCMAYLKRFNLDQLKIDRAFIDELPDNQDDAAITSAIIDVASHLGLITVAEGIETPEQASFLAEMGCIEGQGYLFERPLPAEKIQQLFFE